MSDTEELAPDSSPSGDTVPPEAVPGDDGGMEQPGRAGGARWFRVVVIVGIVVIIGLLVWNLIGGRQPSGAEPTASASAPGSTGTEAGTGGVAGDGGSVQVAAGEGGTGVAQADGRTPVGYELTCTGAVQAATNYLVALTSLDSEQLLTSEQYSALVDELTQGIGTAQPGGASSLKLAYSAQLADLDGFDDFHVQIDPAAGMFRVTECDGQSAVVDILNPGNVRMPAVFDGEPLLDESGEQVWDDGWTLDSDRIHLQLSDGDWALVQLENSAEMDDDPVSAAIDVGREYGDEFTPQMRAEVLAQVGPEWTEYTNAP